MRQQVGRTFNVLTGSMLITQPTTGSTCTIDTLNVGAPVNQPTFETLVRTNITRLNFNGGTISASGTEGRITIKTALNVAPQIAEVATFAGPVYLEGTLLYLLTLSLLIHITLSQY
jgi:hypothetical protein